ncbi:Na+/H+ antiporter subunit E [Pirellulaceae bacterium SH449]
MAVGKNTVGRSIIPVEWNRIENSPGYKNGSFATSRWRWFVKYSVMFSFLWWMLSEGDTQSWVIGGPTVLAAAGASAWLAPATAWQFRWLALIPFLWRFLILSIEGGIDVAIRAFKPRMQIDPRMIEFRTSLPEGTARVFFANAISLCPGSVSANLCEDTIVIHVLDVQSSTYDQLRELERAVVKLFGSHGSEEQKGGNLN